ncbi:MAG: hypothetical protein ACYDH6_08655 [Acidimicrobiales bacterium]
MSDDMVLERLETEQALAKSGVDRNLAMYLAGQMFPPVPVAESMEELTKRCSMLPPAASLAVLPIIERARVKIEKAAKAYADGQPRDPNRASSALPVGPPKSIIPPYDKYTPQQLMDLYMSGGVGRDDAEDAFRALGLLPDDDEDDLDEQGWPIAKAKTVAADAAVVELRKAAADLRVAHPELSEAQAIARLGETASGRETLERYRSRAG